MSAGSVVRRPTPAEEISFQSYGTPYPDPLDLLVELVTARSLHGPTQLSDREIATRLRLRSTDDALRLVKQGQVAGRLLVDEDSNIRRLAIPMAAIVPETAPRATVAAVRAAVPPPSAEPVGRKAQPAPFVARPAREIGPAGEPAAPGEDRGAQGHVVVDEYFQPDPVELPAPPPEIPAKPEEVEAVKPNVVMHINVPRDLHAELQAMARRDGTPMNRIAIDAVIAGLAKTGPGAAGREPVSEQPVVIGDYGSIRVPLALFDAATKAGMSLPVFLEEVISFGMRGFVAKKEARAQ